MVCQTSSLKLSDEWRCFRTTSDLDMTSPRMERVDSGKKRNLLAKALEQCRSFGRRRSPQQTYLRRSRSCQEARVTGSGRKPRTPEGCLAVYVGPGKERFVIRMECVNHPRFKVLLDEAELLYGFSRPGPLELPCEVDRFYKVLGEIDQEIVDPAKLGGGRLGGRRWAAGYQQLSHLV